MVKKAERSISQDDKKTKPNGTKRKVIKKGDKPQSKRATPVSKKKASVRKDQIAS